MLRGEEGKKRTQWVLKRCKLRQKGHSMRQKTSPVHQVSQPIRRQLITLDMHATIALVGIPYLAAWHCRTQVHYWLGNRYVAGSIWRDRKRVSIRSYFIVQMCEVLNDKEKVKFWILSMFWFDSLLSEATGVVVLRGKWPIPSALLEWGPGFLPWNSPSQ